MTETLLPARGPVLSFGFWSFVLVSNFEIRISCFSSLCGALEQMVDQLIEAARRDGAELVAAAVVDEECPVDHDRAAREAHAAIETFDLVVHLRLHQPVGR